MEPAKKYLDAQEYLHDQWRLAAAIRRSGIRFCVDLNRRMAPALQALKARFCESVEIDRFTY